MGVLLDQTLPYNVDVPLICAACGRTTGRRRLILEALAQLDVFSWNLFSSDVFAWDQLTSRFPETVTYDLSAVSVAKWQSWDAYPKAWLPDHRYAGNVFFVDAGDRPSAIFFLSDVHSSFKPPEDAAPLLEGSWYRFGLSDLGAVPAWRQSLFGASTLVQTNPSACVVLVAAGFEAFFSETIRVGWKDKGLDPDAWEKLSNRNIAITSLMEWLPPVVGLRRLMDAPGNLNQRWQEMVNQRRNGVVHRANVHLTSEEALESMHTALECIAYIDELAFVRPHVYYVKG